MIGTYIYEANAVSNQLLSINPFFVQVVFVYDITNQQSFEDLEDWVNLVKNAFKGRPLPQMILLGNKVDLNHMQAVKQDAHQKFAKENKIIAYYASAKTGD